MLSFTIYLKGKAIDVFNWYGVITVAEVKAAMIRQGYPSNILVRKS